MRPLLLLSAFGFAAAAQARPADVPLADEACQAKGPRLAQAPGVASFKRLDELPPANLFLTVLRKEDGCIRPIIVSYGIGAEPNRDRASTLDD